MAAPSIAALYRNSDEPSSAKKRQFTYDEMLDLVRHSYVRAAVRRATLNALTSRGMWPGEDGPATGTICVAFDAMALGDAEGDGMCSRRTAQRRAKLACRLGYWRLVHKFNRWLNCPKCGTERTSANCPNEKCGHKGRSRNRDGTTNTKEFCRPYTFEIDIEKFVKAEPPKYARHFCARTWKEHKAAAKRGEHPNLAEMPSRKPSQQAQPDTSAPVAAKQPAAEHAHRNTVRPEPKPQPKLTKRECAKFVANVEQLRRGRSSYFSRADGLNVALYPGDSGYSPPMPRKAAFDAECARWKRDPEVVRYALNFWGYQLETEEGP